jgi:hypothetical protein
MIRLYHCPRTRAFTALWMLEETGLPYTIETAGIRAPGHPGADLLRVNPMGKVPALADGDCMLGETAAILLYLADRVPAAGLAPAPADQRRGASCRGCAWRRTTRSTGRMACRRWTVSSPGAASCSSTTSCSRQPGRPVAGATRSGRTATTASSRTCSIATPRTSRCRARRWRSCAPTRRAWAGASSGCPAPAASSAGSDFNRDFGVAFTPAEAKAHTPLYNFGTIAFPVEEAPGVSVFARCAHGEIYLTYQCFSRGLDALNPAYQLLDLLPKGRDQDGRGMAWLRRRDEYPA